MLVQDRAPQSAHDGVIAAGIIDAHSFEVASGGRQYGLRPRRLRRARKGRHQTPRNGAFSGTVTQTTERFHTKIERLRLETALGEECLIRI